MEKIAIVVLAAGLGKRLGASRPKVLTETSEDALLFHVLRSLSSLDYQRLIIVTGHQRELVEDLVAQRLSASAALIRPDTLSFAHQSEQLGTGHAVRCALPALKDFQGTALILYGDTPLLKGSTLQSLIDLHHQEKATVSLLSTSLGDPASYGRVVRDPETNLVTEIREAKDCSPRQKLIREINVGVYAVDSAFLKPTIEGLENNNAQKEYYLTDIVAKAHQEGQTVVALETLDTDECLGVNDWYDLALINERLNAKRVTRLQRSGVRVTDPSTCFIDPSVSLSPGVDIGPSVQLRGKTSIASGVVIEGQALLIDCQVQENAHIKLGVRAEGAIIGRDASVGPFAHLRPGSVLGNDSKVGNFVETKNARLAHGVKASHLTYLGDCDIGENSNIGAGTITCNYDGYKKSKTTVGRDVFVGSNTSLVAPVVVEDGAVIGAGSTITQRVEKDSLALSRAPQSAKQGWAKRRREALGGK